MDKVEVCYAHIEASDSTIISSVAMRGFLGHLFIEDTEFHHHSESPYHYPLVQYKKIHGRLLVMGLNDYAKVVCHKMSTLDHITTPAGKIHVQSVDIMSDSFSVKETKARFTFATPWIALNEGNYLKFKRLEIDKRKIFLEKVLVGNILSALKGLSIFVKFKVTADIDAFQSQSVRVHGNYFQAFRTSFTVNVNLPNFFGLGKSVSKGFGAIEAL